MTKVIVYNDGVTSSCPIRRFGGERIKGCTERKGSVGPVVGTQNLVRGGYISGLNHSRMLSVELVVSEAVKNWNSRMVNRAHVPIISRCDVRSDARQGESDGVNRNGMITKMER